MVTRVKRYPPRPLGGLNAPPIDPRRATHNPTKSRILNNTVLATVPNSEPTVCKMA